MKTIEFPKEFGSLLEFAEKSADETVVLTSKKRPIAALVSLRHLDREAAALSASPRIRAIIDASRREIRQGKWSTLEQLKQALQTPKSSRRRLKKSA